MTNLRAIAAALCLAAAGVAPAAAQSVQEAQRQLFVCMQKANNLQLKDEKKSDFINKCVADPDKPVRTDKDPA